MNRFLCLGVLAGAGLLASLPGTAAARAQDVDDSPDERRIERLTRQVEELRDIVAAERAALEKVEAELRRLSGDGEEAARGSQEGEEGR